MPSKVTTIVQREVEDYARGETLKAKTYPISDVSRQSFTILVIPDYPRYTPAGIVVAARVVGDYVVIDEDITDRPLFEELIRAGIPREKITCAYAGEEIPAEKTP